MIKVSTDQSIFAWTPLGVLSSDQDKDVLINSLKRFKDAGQIRQFPNPTGESFAMTKNGLPISLPLINAPGLMAMNQLDVIAILTSYHADEQLRPVVTTLSRRGSQFVRLSLPPVVVPSRLFADSICQTIDIIESFASRVSASQPLFQGVQP